MVEQIKMAQYSLFQTFLVLPFRLKRYVMDILFFKAQASAKIDVLFVFDG